MLYVVGSNIEFYCYRKFMFEKDLLMLSDDISDLNYYYHKQGFIDGFKVAMTLMGGRKREWIKNYLINQNSFVFLLY